MAISADARHSGANAAVLKAAGVHRKPVAGTGGTSLSLAAAIYGCELAGNAGGSVATTARTKAIGIAASLAGVWNESYVPSNSSVAATPWRSVVSECLPAFVCVACARSAADSLALKSLSDLLRSGKVVAPAVGALAATRRSDLGSIATLAGALLGSFSQGSSCCALIAGGFAFPQLAPQVLAACARHGVPATSSNIAVGGAVPVVLGAACYGILSPVIAEVADAVRWLIRTGTSWWLVSAIVGAVINYGSRKDWYHAYFLPLLALEYEFGDMSAIGALDFLCLCVTSAGACAAQLVVPLVLSSLPPSKRKQHPPTTANHVTAPPSESLRVSPHTVSKHAYTRQDIRAKRSAAENPMSTGRSPGVRGSHSAHIPLSTSANTLLDADSLLARRGLVINLLCGDYVEACHPFLDRDSTLDWAVYLTSFLAGGLAAGCLSSAYLPMPFSLFFSNEMIRLTMAAIVAFIVPFSVGAVSNIYSHRHKQHSQ